jgi:D-serine dehydratase
MNRQMKKLMKSASKARPFLEKVWGVLAEYRGVIKAQAKELAKLQKAAIKQWQKPTTGEMTKFMNEDGDEDVDPESEFGDEDVDPESEGGFN